MAKRAPRRRRPQAPDWYPHSPVFQPIPRAGGIGGEWFRWIGSLVIAGVLGWFALDTKTAVLIERVDQHYRGFDWRLQQIENALRIPRP